MSNLFQEDTHDGNTLFKHLWDILLYSELQNDTYNIKFRLIMNIFTIGFFKGYTS